MSALKKEFAIQNDTESLSQERACKVDKQFRIQQRPLHNPIYLTDSSANRYIEERGTVCQGMRTWGLKSKKNEKVQVSAYSSRQFDDP